MRQQRGAVAGQLKWSQFNIITTTFTALCSGAAVASYPDGREPFEAQAVGYGRGIGQIP